MSKHLAVTEAEEKLGPVDLGPEKRWRHFGFPKTLCGIETPRIVHGWSDPSCPMCPDCERKHGQ